MISYKCGSLGKTAGQPVEKSGIPENVPTKEESETKHKGQKNESLQQKERV